jgi:hypothetical protein
MRPSRPRGWSRKRIVVGIVLVVVAAFVLQRLSTGRDSAQISRAVEAAATSTDPSYCRESVTAGYLQQTTGAKAPYADQVCESEAGMGGADSVDVSDIAIDGSHATARVAYEGGSLDGARLAVRLVKEGKDWRLDELVAFEEFDRAKFDRSYRRDLVQFGAPRRAVECALARVGAYSDRDLQQVVLQSAHAVFLPILVGCDRGGVEQNLIESVADPKLGFPKEMVSCATERIRSSTDAELARLQLDLDVYGRLLFSCDSEAVFAYLRRELRAYELDSGAVDCVLSALRKLPPVEAMRLTYDEGRYEELIASCKG